MNKLGRSFQELVDNRIFHYFYTAPPATNYNQADWPPNLRLETLLIARLRQPLEELLCKTYPK